jgi:sugar/nucleoside kinase (ribokinase family)
VLVRLSPDNAIVTIQGSWGALARRGNQILRAGTFKVDSIDGSGSGDAFDAGFLVGVLEGWALEDLVRFAGAAGASCTRAVGCHDGVFRFDEAMTFIVQSHLEITRVA